MDRLFGSTPQNTKNIVLYSTAAAVFLFTCVILSMPKRSSLPSTVNPALVQRSAGPQYVSRSGALKNFRIDGFRWEKGGFGSVMIATFVIYNDNDFSVKDITVTCVHKTKSDTVIDRNSRTLYEQISARGYHSVVDANMGFIHSAAASSVCRVTDFARS